MRALLIVAILGSALIAFATAPADARNMSGGASRGASGQSGNLTRRNSHFSSKMQEYRLENKYFASLLHFEVSETFALRTAPAVIPRVASECPC